MYAIRSYYGGVLWGLIPTILFFLVAFLCYRKSLPLSVVLIASFAAWAVAAAIHQWWLR